MSILVSILRPHLFSPLTGLNREFLLYMDSNTAGQGACNNTIQVVSEADLTNNNTLTKLCRQWSIAIFRADVNLTVVISKS